MTNVQRAGVAVPQPIPTHGEGTGTATPAPAPTPLTGHELPWERNDPTLQTNRLQTHTAVGWGMGIGGPVGFMAGVTAGFYVMDKTSSPFLKEGAAAIGLLTGVALGLGAGYLIGRSFSGASTWEPNHAYDPKRALEAATQGLVGHSVEAADATVSGAGLAHPSSEYVVTKLDSVETSREAAARKLYARTAVTDVAATPDAARAVVEVSVPNATDDRSRATGGEAWAVVELAHDPTAAASTVDTPPAGRTYDEWQAPRTVAVLAHRTTDTTKLVSDADHHSWQVQRRTDDVVVAGGGLAGGSSDGVDVVAAGTPTEVGRTPVD